MIRQPPFPGTPSELAIRLAQRWRRIRVRLGAGPLAPEGHRRDIAEAYQHRSEVNTVSCGETGKAGPPGRSNEAPPGKVEGTIGPRSTTGDGDGYCFVSVSDSEGISLFSATAADGSRAVVLFDDQLTAEAFVLVEGLGEGWEISEPPPSRTAILLEACMMANVGYVALNPPSRAIGARCDLRLVPIASFVRSLPGEEGA